MPVRHLLSKNFDALAGAPTPLLQLSDPIEENRFFMSTSNISLLKRSSLLAAIMAATALVASAGPRNGASPALVQASDLVHLGTFTVPRDIHAGGKANAGFEYGGTAISYDAARNGLFMVGHDWDQFIGEISIPEVGGAAKLLQRPIDATEGIKDWINPGSSNAKKIGGTLVWGNQLIISIYDYYDGRASQTVSHVSRPSDLSVTGKVKGPFRMGPLNAGFYSGYMAAVPLALRPLLGGPALTGQADIGIISRTSLGPAAFSFDPEAMGMMPAQPLVYYPLKHPTLGVWGAAGKYFGGSDSLEGVVVPEGWSSVLFFGQHGTTFCYGPGTANQKLAGTPANRVDTWCYDPIKSAKGTHGYPYVSQVTAYAASDLAEVREGKRKPWEVRPYAAWVLPELHGRVVGGVAYDPATGRLFVSELRGDGVYPLVHVYVLKGTAIKRPRRAVPRAGS